MPSRSKLFSQYLKPSPSDGYAKASPACARAVLETVEALRKEGHECVEFDVPGGELSARPLKLHGITTLAFQVPGRFTFSWGSHHRMATRR